MRSLALATGGLSRRGRRRGTLAASIALVLALALGGCVTPGGLAPASTLPPVGKDLVFGATKTLGRDGFEPVVRVAPDGTVYVAALQFMWVSRDNGTTFQPAQFTDVPIYASDSALAVAPDGRAYVTFDWPYAGETAVCTSAAESRGAKWECQRVVVAGATDRMWIVAPTEKDAYVITGQGLDRPTFAVTHDAGKTWTTTSQELQETDQGSDLAWDPVQKLVVEGASGSGGKLSVREFKPDGTRLPNVATDLRTPEPQLAVGDDGAWWAVACAHDSGACGLAVARSADLGKTWVKFPIETQKNALLPYVTAGRDARAAIAWYEANGSTPADAANEWRVRVVWTTDAGASWSNATLAEKVHKGAMCRAVDCLGEDRFAGDFLGVAFGPDGALHATWMKQSGSKGVPTTQLKTGDWDDVQYARTT